MDTESLGSSFRKSIQNKTIDLSVDYSEAILDTVITDELLKEIPIIKTIITVAKIGNSIKNQFLFKKILKFLFELDSISFEERQAFLDNLDKDSNSKSTYDNFLIIIDRLDNVEKAHIIGRLFKSLICEKIEIQVFFRLASIVENVYIDDLIILNGHINPNNDENTRIGYEIKLNNTIKVNLANNGLMSPIYGSKTYDVKADGSAITKVYVENYEVSVLGELLIATGF